MIYYVSVLERYCVCSFESLIILGLRCATHLGHVHVVIQYLVSFRSCSASFFLLVYFHDRRMHVARKTVEDLILVKSC